MNSKKSPCKCSQASCPHCRDELFDYKNYNRKQRTQKQIQSDIALQSKLCNYPQCDRYGEIIDFSEFYKHKPSPDGRQSWCKKCTQKYKKTKNGYVASKKYESENKEFRNSQDRKKLKGYKKLGNIIKSMRSDNEEIKQILKSLGANHGCDGLGRVLNPCKICLIIERIDGILKEKGKI